MFKNIFASSTPSQKANQPITSNIRNLFGNVICNLLRKALVYCEKSSQPETTTSHTTSSSPSSTSRVVKSPNSEMLLKEADTSYLLLILLLLITLAFYYAPSGSLSSIVHSKTVTRLVYIVKSFVAIAIIKWLEFVDQAKKMYTKIKDKILRPKAGLLSDDIIQVKFEPEDDSNSSNDNELVLHSPRYKINLHHRPGSKTKTRGGLKSYQKLAGLEFHDKSDKYRVRITPKPANVIIKDEANLYMDSNDARTKKPGVAVYLSSNMDQY